MRIDQIEIPDVTYDHETLAAFYSGFAFSEHYRKVCLAALKEMLRASASLTNQKVTETRLDDMSRIHPLYLQFLTEHLHGRREWEKQFKAQGGMK